MRLLKAFVAMIIGLSVLFGVAALVMPADRIANIAAQQFQNTTGRSLHFGGDVKASFYPVIGATAQSIQIGNPDWAGDAPMLSAAEMDFGLDVMALIRGDIVVERVVLRDPDLHLIRDAQGRTNWTLTQAEGSGTSEAAPSDAPSEAQPSRQQRGFSLAEARIIGGNLRFEDRQSGTDLRVEGLEAGLRLPSYAGAAELVASGRMNGQPFQMTAQTENAERLVSGAVTPITVEATVAGATLSFAGRAGLEALALEGQVTTSIPALSPLMQLAGQSGGDISSDFLPLGMSGQLTRTADGRVFARDAQFRAGGVRLSGALDLVPGADLPRLTGQLSGAVLDLRSAGATGQSGQGGQSGQAGGSNGWSRAPIDADALGLLDAEITLALAGLRTDLTTLGRTRLGLTIDRARAVFDLREVAAFGGQVAGEFVMNNRSGLSVGGNLRARGIDLLPLLTELADYRRLQGLANADLQFLGVGNTMHDIMNSLRGEGSLAFSQGEIIGFDLAGMLRNLDMSYMGEGNRTVYQSINGSFTIADGVLRNNDLRLDASRLSVVGQGQVGLGARNLDYRIIPAALGSDAGEVLRVPLMITGPWESPRFRLDLEALAREQLRIDQERLEDMAREEAQRLEERARAQAERRLQQELGVERQDGERIEDTLRRGLEAEIGSRLRGLLGGN
ncbi:AsmA family protein [Roseinatronobacter bogoriensis]|nr:MULTISPECIES: AsmA family protein [Rhodobaca]MBB4208083.1 AsmA protein [Rhodobaca bogoriensis DSM 18756]TDW38723.1 AsmA protein [Rhodobaca barguzinensis]TDY69239.1 AsmA protein [Rhodobaca bogoriensis DSM 18756]